MLREHLPELLPTWERLVELVGGGDLEARFLSLYDPPAFLAGCTQALWTHRTPALVRNYDYAPHQFDGLILRSAFNGTATVAMSDCVWGVLDGDQRRTGSPYRWPMAAGTRSATASPSPWCCATCWSSAASVAEAVAVLRRVPDPCRPTIVALLDAHGPPRHRVHRPRPAGRGSSPGWSRPTARPRTPGPTSPSVQDSALREAVVQARLSDPAAGLEQIVADVSSPSRSGATPRGTAGARSTPPATCRPSERFGCAGGTASGFRVLPGSRLASGPCSFRGGAPFAPRLHAH